MLSRNGSERNSMHMGSVEIQFAGYIPRISGYISKLFLWTSITYMTSVHSESYHQATERKFSNLCSVRHSSRRQSPQSPRRPLLLNFSVSVRQPRLCYEMRVSTMHYDGSITIIRDKRTKYHRVACMNLHPLWGCVGCGGNGLERCRVFLR